MASSGPLTASASSDLLHHFGIAPATAAAFRIDAIPEADLARLLKDHQRKHLTARGLSIPTWDPRDPATVVGLIRLQQAQRKHSFVTARVGIAGPIETASAARVVIADTPLLATNLYAAGVPGIALVESPAVLAPLADWLRERAVVVVSAKAASLTALREILTQLGVDAEEIRISSIFSRSRVALLTRLGIQPLEPVEDAEDASAPLAEEHTDDAPAPIVSPSDEPSPKPSSESPAPFIPAVTQVSDTTPTPEPASAPDTASDIAVLLDHDRQRRTTSLRVGSCLFVVEIPRDPEQPSEVRVTYAEQHHTGEVRFAVADTLKRYAEIAARRLHLPCPLLLRHLFAVRTLVDRLSAEAPVHAAARPHGTITETERAEAETWLRSNDLLERITDVLTELGWVADPAQRRLGILTALSRHSDQPAWVAFSAAATLPAYGVHLLAEITPPEDLVRATCLSDHALVQAETDALRHRLLVIDDLAVSAKVATSLRVLSVNGCLTTQQPLRDPETGITRLRLHRVDGPVAVLGAVTAGSLDRRLDPYLATVPTDDADVDDAADTSDADAAPSTAASMVVRQPSIPRPSAERRALLIRRMHVLQRVLGTAEVTIADPALIAPPRGSPATQRDHRIVAALASASALLHRRQRAVVDDRVIVSAADVALARDLTRCWTGLSAHGISPIAERLLNEWRASGDDERAIASWQERHPYLSRHALDRALAELIDAGLVIASGGGRRGQTRAFRLPAAELGSPPRTSAEFRGGTPQVFGVFERYSPVPNAISPVRVVG